MTDDKTQAALDDLRALNGRIAETKKDSADELAISAVVYMAQHCKALEQALTAQLSAPRGDIGQLKQEVCSAFTVETATDTESRLRRVTIQDTIDFLHRAGYLTPRQEWQPIETAPKDGSYNLYYRPDYPRPFIGWSTLSDVAPTENVQMATHWIPLPSAPGAPVIPPPDDLEAIKWNRDMSAAPHREPICAPRTIRYLPYKPDGARQMGKPGRWQEWNGYGWSNCEDEPTCWQPLPSAALEKAGA